MLRSWITWLGALAAVTALMVVFRADLDRAHIALGYLMLVLLASSRAQQSLGLTLSVLAFLAFNFWFVPPYHTLVVAAPMDWLVLAAFLVTSIVAARLLTRAQAEAEAARARTIEIDRLSSVRSEADALRRADELKDALLASVSHDLRTPLTTIKALAHDIRMEGDDRAAIIEEEADRLNRFVADLLDLSRLAGGALTMALEINAADDLVGAAVQRAAGALTHHALDVHLDPSEPLLAGRFDFVHSLRVLVNLIENAAKYSPAGSTIDLDVRRADAWLAFAVADRGPGVPVAERERIFEPYYSPGGIRDAAGAGLGLSIAHGMAQAQGASITYEPRDGGGSVFTYRVPLADVESL